MGACVGVSVRACVRVHACVCLCFCLLVCVVVVVVVVCLCFFLFLQFHHRLAKSIEYTHRTIAHTFEKHTPFHTAIVYSST